MHNVMSILAKKRKLFHSEADFQHTLAWELHEYYPDSEIRLEYKPKDISERIYLDIWIKHREKYYAIELKYKTRDLSITDSEERYELVTHGAQDLGRYDFLKDVQRIENLAQMGTDTMGIALFLTNDSSYWKPTVRNTGDSEFRIHEGAVLSGELAWTSGVSEGTTKKREDPIVLKNMYTVQWNTYSELGKVKYGMFKYLLITS